MYPSKNDYPDDTRRTAIAYLQKRLADAVDLTLQCKQAHWTVRGPEFYSLHLLFDRVHEHARAWADLIAERIQQLGGQAEGTCQAVLKSTSLPEFPLDLTDEIDEVDVLSSAFAEFGSRIRQAGQEATLWRDLATVDIFTEISRGVDVDLWMLESHLVAPRRGRQGARGAA